MDITRTITALMEKGKTMSDYIKREDAFELIDKCISHTSPKAKVMDFLHGTINGLNWACDIIEAMPSADVAPVRHGRWDFDMSGAWCSVCGEYSEGEYRYCPSCGSKMDGGDDDEKRQV